ncbi:MAG: FHA domain-containing protein [Actinobacteria bacterium]|nr:FHA domain-containing protein [Actinomycetota bacterium]
MTGYAVIGDGAAGTTAVEYIRRTDPSGRITMYSEDPTPAYYRAALTNYLMGELRAEQLFAVPPDFYSRYNVERVLTRVDGVDTANRRLKLSNGQQAAFDKLMIAAGARATMPPFKGIELEGVMPMRTMQDGRACMDMIQSGRLKHAVIVGGGILGIEWVAGLRSRGIDVTFLIREDMFWQGIIDRTASDLVLSRCRDFGVDVRLEEEIEEITGRHGAFRGVRLKNSKDKIDAQLLGMAIGIRPNIEFLKDSGITTDRGIPIDDHMRTNIDGIYAGGDIAEINDPFVGKRRGLGLWEPARHHGTVAGINMAGGDASWKLDVNYNATRLYDLDLAAVGDPLERPTDDVLSVLPMSGGTIEYRKLVIRDGRLVGALLLGLRKTKVRSRGQQLRKVIELGLDVSEVRGKLFDPFFDLPSWIGTQVMGGTSTGKPTEVTEKPKVSSILGRSEMDITGTPKLVSAAASSNIATLMRPPSVMTLSAEAQTVKRPVEPGGVSPTAKKAPPATLRLNDGRLLPIGQLLRIGSNPDNNLVMTDPRVSDHHAEIRRQGDGFVIADMGSATGTFVNEQPVRPAESRRLLHKDSIRVVDMNIEFIQQVAQPRPNTGPAGLPDEPLGPTPSSILLGKIEFEGRVIDLVNQETDIGQDPISEIKLTDPAASFNHCQISRQGQSLFLRDLGSKTGTYVNDELLTVPRPLQDGDVIRIGQSGLVFQAFTTSGTRVPASPPAPIPTIEDAAPIAVAEEEQSPQDEIEEEPAPKLTDKARSTGKATKPTQPPVPDRVDATVSNARLKGISGQIAGVSFHLSGSKVTIGADGGTDISLTNPTLEPQHASLDQRAGEWVLSDTSATAGTYLNGERLPKKMKAMLTHGDTIKLGDIEFVFESPEWDG